MNEGRSLRLGKQTSIQSEPPSPCSGDSTHLKLEDSEIKNKSSEVIQRTNTRQESVVGMMLVMM